MASELSVSETDGDNQSTDGEEVKIGLETEPVIKCTSSVPISVRESVAQKIVRLDVPSALDNHKSLSD